MLSSIGEPVSKFFRPDYSSDSNRSDIKVHLECVEDEWSDTCEIQGGLSSLNQ